MVPLGSEDLLMQAQLASLSSFDVNFSEHSRRLVQWIEERVGELLDGKQDDSRVKIKRARFIYEIGINKLRFIGVEDV